jgi:hypothetical protein
MQRHISTQDLSWFLDLSRNKQLDLDPPYQRRSVWTRKDRQFFLDTIFRNYPSPAIFLHKTVDEEGASTYHVVDGKQRIQTILQFVNGEVRISSDYGDSRLDGKRWSDLEGQADLKKAFWNYKIPVEMLDIVEDSQVNQVFDRLNRNSRKLTRQELRHAQFDGWLIETAEAEAEREEWKEFGVVTAARSRRMADVQFISELLLVILEERVLDFDQNFLDELYGKYEDPENYLSDFDEGQFHQRLLSTKDYLRRLENVNACITEYTRPLYNFYSLWCAVALTPAEALPSEEQFAERYDSFMQKVDEIAEQDDLPQFLEGKDSSVYRLPFTYYENTRGANTDVAQRLERHKALLEAVGSE